MHPNTRAERRHQSLKHQHKQEKLLKLYGLPLQPIHYYNKHHALDCGRPRCSLCQNPRRTHKNTLSIQEQRFYQDIEDDYTFTSGNNTNIS